MAIDNRAALIQGARQCIEDIGYARTTARDVATAAGVSLGAIGYHFGSKEELLNEAIGDAFRDWFTSFDSLIAQSDVQGFDAVVRQVIPRFSTLLETSRPLLAAFVEAMAQSQHVPELREQLAQQYRENRQSAVAMMAAALASQEIESTLPLDTFSSLLIAVVDGLVLQFLLEPADTPSAEHLVDAYDLLFRTITGLLPST